MKKFLSVILALAMAMSLSVSAFAADFNDVSSSHTNYEAIDTLKTLDIVNGYSATKYGPNDILTRAQLCTMIVRAVYGDDTHYNSVNVFNDVSVSHWARIYIDTAYNHGVMSGYGNGAFGPEDQLTYTQTARVILNILGYGKLDWPLGVNTVAYELGLYDDVAVSVFYSSDCHWCNFFSTAGNNAECPRHFNRTNRTYSKSKRVAGNKSSGRKFFL